MKKIILISILLIATSLQVNAEEKKSKLKLKTDSKVTDLIKNTDMKSKLKLKTDSKVTDLIKNTDMKSKLKLKTDSKLTDWITGKDKLKLPNPLSGLKKIGKALKPSPVN
jgi:hypothetical protein